MKRARHLSVSGVTGMGKTSLVRILFNEREERRRIIVDPKNEYAGDVERVVYSKAELDAYLADVKVGDASWPFSVAYVPDDVPEPDAVEHAASWADYLEEVLLVVDEAHDSCSAKTCKPKIITLAKRGRDAGVAVWCCSQRPVDIHPSLRSELLGQEAWYLRLAEKNDLDFVRDRRGADFELKIKKLPELETVRLLPAEEIAENYRIEFTPGLRVGSLHRI